jgi:hypothetical protein
MRAMAISTLSTIPSEEIKIMVLNAIKLAMISSNPYIKLVTLAALYKVVALSDQ